MLREDLAVVQGCLSGSHSGTLRLQQRSSVRRCARKDPRCRGAALSEEFDPGGWCRVLADGTVRAVGVSALRARSNHPPSGVERFVHAPVAGEQEVWHWWDRLVVPPLPPACSQCALVRTARSDLFVARANLEVVAHLMLWSLVSVLRMRRASCADMVGD
jgi:hypothetical protein